MCYHRVIVGVVCFRSQIEQFEAHMRSGAMSSGGGGGGTASVNMTRDVQELRDRVTRLEQSNSVKDSLISELKIQLRNHEMVTRLQWLNTCSSSRPCAHLQVLRVGPHVRFSFIATPILGFQFLEVAFSRGSKRKSHDCVIQLIIAVSLHAEKVHVCTCVCLCDVSLCSLHTTDEL